MPHRVVIAFAMVFAAALPRLGHAEPARPALWSSSVPAGEAAPLRRAIEASSRVTLLDPGALRARLEELARPLQDDPRARARDEALRAAREAYVNLRLDDARAAYGRALESALAAERRPAGAAAVASLVFERALVALAAQKRADARRDLLAAVAIDPSLAPSPDVYGPPVFRALEEARAALARAPTARIEIDRAPADAIVRVDGAIVPPGAAATVRLGAAHLVVAERPGHVPRAVWLEPPPRAGARIALVLPEAAGALLAGHALDAWTRAAAPSGETGALVARALGIAHVVEATRDAAGTTRLVLRDARTGALVRSAEGGPVPWEPRPFFVLAEALEGRVVEPPPRTAAASLVASLPSDVPPGEPFALRVTLRDPAARVRQLEARCGASRARLRLPPASDGGHSLAMRAPDREGEVACTLAARDAAGRLVVSLPAAGDRLAVRVAEREASGSMATRWWFWSAVGVVAAGGVVAALLVSADEGEPQQVLVMHAP